MIIFVKTKILFYGGGIAIVATQSLGINATSKILNYSKILRKQFKQRRSCFYIQ